MVNYRRNYVAGGTCAFTVALKDRGSNLLVQQIHELRFAIQSVRGKWPFVIHAMVVMPDHLHAIWQLPGNDSNYSVRWRQIKSAFTRSVGIGNSPWQSRFWEHTVRDEADFANHVAYIHYNPVKHGYVSAPADWKYSSIHRWIKAGDLPGDWGESDCAALPGFGEP